MSHSTTNESRRTYDPAKNAKVDKAAQLFDLVFSQPKVPIHKSPPSSSSTFSMTKSAAKKVEKMELPCGKSDSPSSTGGFSSPTSSIPDMTLEKSDSSEEEELSVIAHRTVSTKVKRSPEIPLIKETDNTESSKCISSKRMREFASDSDDDDDDIEIKRSRHSQSDECVEQDVTTGTKLPFFPSGSKNRKPVYNHKWQEDDDEDEDGFDKKNPSKTSIQREAAPSMTSPKTISTVTAYKDSRSSQRIRNVKEAHHCLESGERLDYKNDIEYTLGTLADANSSLNVKCLSLTSLAKKCLSPDFRQFLRMESFTGKIFRAIVDVCSSPNIGICAACFIYLMSRDKASMVLDAALLRLLSQLIKHENLKFSPEYTKYSSAVWDILEEYREKSSTVCPVQFDITKEKLSTSFLILESLSYLCFMHPLDDNLKNELLNMGVLQWIVSKVDKLVLRMLHEKMNEEDKLHCLNILKRCFSVLEVTSAYNLRNQAYLISHRGSALLQSSGRLIGICHKSVDDDSDHETEKLKTNMTCLLGLCSVLMNLSHENELCCTKLGQMAGFLPLCMSLLTYLTPKFSSESHSFDLAVMISCLLVNVVERCNSNRQKLIDLTVPLYDRVSKNQSYESVLVALTRQFLYHDSRARTVDEELDNDLVLEDVPEGSGNEDEDEGDGRLNRGLQNMTEDEMCEAVRNVMNKASDHMEDSVLASYTALLIGCLLQQNEENVIIIKKEMPNGKLDPMIEQLQRFSEFMKLMGKKKVAQSHRSMEKIIELLEKLNV
ncbi:hypothetical protein AB6A40_006488 [Gnathostoma spinigerum]|uniref:WAPL domain-containing protein n=1 Tax=Gnathostoma spinigerum TaxID=75299 RepID=A0ABD6ENQ3_9BILA